MDITIRVNSLSKTYRVYQKSVGLKASLKGIFHRQYQDNLAVDNISFQLNSNELVGFIGPNGAGKTTTLKMLSGLLFPTSGEIKVLGFNPWRRQPQFLRQISLVMGQKSQLWWDLPAIESFHLAKDIYGLTDKQYKHSFNALVEMLDLSTKLNVQVRQLSLGERMKAELAVALLHQPKILFLDEPTIGLDVVTQQKVRDFIKQYNQEFKGSILLTSHYMADVQELCRRVIILNHGQIIFDGLLTEIVKQFSQGKTIKTLLAKDVPLKNLTKYSEFVTLNHRLATFNSPINKIAPLTTKLLDTLPIIDLTIQEPELDEVIRSIFNTPSL